MSATVHSIDAAWIDRARAVPIEAEIKRRGIPLKRNGAERVGPCPKCGGDDRFSINPKKNVFYCRRCDVGGDGPEAVSLRCLQLYCGGLKWIAPNAQALKAIDRRQLLSSILGDSGDEVEAG